MTFRNLASLGVATGALVAASPALAQPEMTYEQGGYEYAQSAPAPAAPPVTYRSDPVVQSVPAPAPHVAHTYPTARHPEVVEEYEVEREYHTRPAHYPHHAPVTTYPAAHHETPAHHPQMPAFDRGAWLDECEDRFRAEYGGRRKGDGGVVGGLLGAVAGGIIGNRVADGERLAGTLIGGGIGGLAGLAIGSAISAATDKDKRRDAREYCEDYLSRYSYGYRNMGAHGYGYGYPQGYYGYGYGYAQPMMLVPVVVPVRQRKVVREYVTEEYVPVTTYEYEEVPARRVIKRVPVKTQPRRTKRIKTQYRKGK